MISIVALVTGAVMEMADDDSTILFGAPASKQAVFRASCGTPLVDMKAGTPFPPHLVQEVSPYGFGRWTGTIPKSMADLQIEVHGMYPTCANRIPHLEPCVPHDPDAPSHFKCKWTGSAGEIEMPGSPYAQWMEAGGLKTGLVAKVNCSAPPYESVAAAVGYDSSRDFGNGASLTVTLKFGSHDITYMGEPDANKVTFVGWNTPPLAPSPPSLPPPPETPCGPGCPGNLFKAFRGYVEKWSIATVNQIQNNAGTNPHFGGLQHLCYSSLSREQGGLERDTSAREWHQQCDNRGKTVVMMKASKGTGGLKVFGGTSTKSWFAASNAYATSEGAFLFSITNDFKHTWKAGLDKAIYTHANYGPTWGNGHDLQVPAGHATVVCNGIGTAYNFRAGNTDGNSQDFCSQTGTTLDEMEVWSEFDAVQG